MLKAMIIKLKLVKLKHYSRKENKAFHEGNYEEAIKFGKIVSNEFDKLFG